MHRAGLCALPGLHCTVHATSLASLVPKALPLALQTRCPPVGSPQPADGWPIGRQAAAAGAGSASDAQPARQQPHVISELALAHTLAN